MRKVELSAVSGPRSSKLTTSLVNVSLKFQTLISQISHFFVEKNVRSFSHFSNKNISVFGYKVVNLTLNEMTS